MSERTQQQAWLPPSDGGIMIFSKFIFA